MKRNAIRIAFAATLMLGLIPRSAESGPVLPYYVSGYDIVADASFIYVVQGNSVINSWSVAGSTGFEYPISVQAGLIRTTGFVETFDGAEYTTSGVPTGPTFPHPSGTGTHFDGTTNGFLNFAWDYESGTAYQMDLDWSNPQLLFTFGNPFERAGITYDPSNDSLWIGGFDPSLPVIENLALDGSFISSFSVPVSQIEGLALDAVSGHLWFASQNDEGSVRTFYEYDRLGNQISTSLIPGLDNVFFSGEFEFVSSVPEPTSLILVGIAGLALFMTALRKRSQNQAVRVPIAVS